MLQIEATWTWSCDVPDCPVTLVGRGTLYDGGLLPTIPNPPRPSWVSIGSESSSRQLHACSPEHAALIAGGMEVVALGDWYVRPLESIEERGR